MILGMEQLDYIIEHSQHCIAKYKHSIPQLVLSTSSSTGCSLTIPLEDFPLEPEYLPSPLLML